LREGFSVFLYLCYNKTYIFIPFDCWSTIDHDARTTGKTIWIRQRT
jgi:hypothetical protein